MTRIFCAVLLCRNRGDRCCTGHHGGATDARRPTTTWAPPAAPPRPHLGATLVRPRSALACFRPRCCRRTGLHPARLPPVYRGPSSHRRPAGTTLRLTLLCNVLHHFTALSPFGRFFCFLRGRPPSSPSPSLLLPPGLLGLRAFPLGAPPLHMMLVGGDRGAHVPPRGWQRVCRR